MPRNIQLQHSAPRVKKNRDAVRDVYSTPRKSDPDVILVDVYGSFDIFHPGLVIIQRPSPDISQYIPSFSRYCMEMLGRGLSRRVPRGADLFAVTKDERNRNRNTTIIRHDIEPAIVPIFAPFSKWFNVNVSSLSCPIETFGIQDSIYTSVFF